MASDKPRGPVPGVYGDWILMGPEAQRKAYCDVVEQLEVAEMALLHYATHTNWLADGMCWRPEEPGWVTAEEVLRRCLYECNWTVNDNYLVQQIMAVHGVRDDESAKAAEEGSE